MAPQSGSVSPTFFHGPPHGVSRSTPGSARAQNAGSSAAFPCRSPGTPSAHKVTGRGPQSGRPGSCRVRGCGPRCGLSTGGITSLWEPVRLRPVTSFSIVSESPVAGTPLLRCGSTFTANHLLASLRSNFRLANPKNSQNATFLTEPIESPPYGKSATLLQHQAWPRSRMTGAHYG